MDEIGPVDYAIIGFPGNQFRGDIAPALADLSAKGTIRIIDVAFVSRSENGDVEAFELTQLDAEVQAGLEAMGVEVSGLLSEEDMLAIGEGLEPSSSAALIVWENVWARGVASAVRGAGGQLLDFGRIPHDVVQAAREFALSEA